MASKRFNLLAAAIGLAFLILGAFAWGTLRKIQLDNGSSDLAIQLLQTSLTAGSAETLIDHAHPELLAFMPAQSFNAYIGAAVRNLGSLQEMSSISGASSAGMLALPNQTINASYVIELQLGETPVSAVMDLRYEDSQWWLLNLLLDTPQLMQ